MHNGISLRNINRSCALAEGGRKSLSIAQVAEVNGKALRELAGMPVSHALAIIAGKRARVETVTGKRANRGRRWLIERVTAEEGGAVSCSIAQVSEVVKLFLSRLDAEPAWKVAALLEETQVS